MTQIPRAPLFLGVAGVIPFVWSALTTLSDSLAAWSVRTLSARFTGPYVGIFFGAVMLSFTSGILWGFAARARDGKASLGYVLAVLPAVWAFAMTGGGARSAALNLSIGFLASLVLDALFTRYRLTPDWWMSLRLPLTLATVTCLLITAAL